MDLVILVVTYLVLLVIVIAVELVSFRNEKP
jgi:hypothetical protein